MTWWSTVGEPAQPSCTNQTRGVDLLFGYFFFFFREGVLALSPIALQSGERVRLFLKKKKKERKRKFTSYTNKHLKRCSISEIIKKYRENQENFFPKGLKIRQSRLSRVQQVLPHMPAKGDGCSPTEHWRVAVAVQQ